MLANSFLRLMLGLLFTCYAAFVHSETSETPFQEFGEEGVLSVAVYKQFAPYSYKNKSGKLVGIDVELAEALSSELGLGVRWIMVTADESLEDDLRNFVWKGHYLGGEVANVMMHVPYDIDFAKDNDQVLFHGVYYRESVAISYLESRYGDVINLLPFMSGKIGVELDTISDHYLSSALGGILADTPVRFLSVAKAFDALSHKEVDAVMAPRGELQGALAALTSKKDGLIVSEIALVGMFQQSWDIGMAVKAGNNPLAQRLDMALAKLVSEGRVDKIFKKYGVTRVAPLKQL